MSKQLQHIQQLLGLSPQLRGLKKNIQQQQQLVSAIRQQLPAELAQHCTHATLDKGQLTISTDTPVWASKLRFLTPRLLSQLRKSYPGIANIKVLSKPDMPYKIPGKRRPKPQYPAYISRSLEEQAKHLPSPELGDAFRRLAKTLENQI